MAMLAPTTAPKPLATPAQPQGFLGQILPQIKPAVTQMTPPKPVTALGASVRPAAPQAPTSFSPGVNLTPTNPQNDLRGQTITPGPMADRNKIAQTYENNWNSATAPQFQADLRNATSQAAGAGQLGSGQLRTSLGNLAYNRDVNRNAQEGNFMNNALSGSIDDAYRNVAQANQQQQFQAGLQNQTFNQGLQSLLAGESGNPSQTQLGLSGIYNNQAGQAGQGLNNLISGSINNNTQQDALQQILQRIGGSGGNAQAPQPVGTVPTPTPTYPSSGVGGVFNDPSKWLPGGQ